MDKLLDAIRAFAEITDAAIDEMGANSAQHVLRTSVAVIRSALEEYDAACAERARVMQPSGGWN